MGTGYTSDGNPVTIATVSSTQTPEGNPIGDLLKIASLVPAAFLAGLFIGWLIFELTLAR